MSISTIVNIRFEEMAEAEEVPVTLECAVNEALFREELRREYWGEAINAGMTTVEAAEYAVRMTGEVPA